MGFFNGLSKQEENYKKALKKAMSKRTEDSLKELEEAVKQVPNAWEGYLFIALCYGLAVGKVPFDLEKSKNYHTLARSAGENNENCQTFYYCYDMSPINFEYPDLELYPRTLEVRRVSVAICTMLDVSNPKQLVTKGIVTDYEYWNAIVGPKGVDTGGLFKSTEEQKQVHNQIWAIYDYLNAYHFYTTTTDGNDEDLMRNINHAVSRNNRFIDDFPSLDLYKRDKDKYDQIKKDLILKGADLYRFVFGMGLFNVGPYSYLQGRNNWSNDIRIDAVKDIVGAERYGFTAATYSLCSFMEMKDLDRMVLNAYNAERNRVIDHLLNENLIAIRAFDPANAQSFSNDLMVLLNEKK